MTDENRKVFDLKQADEILDEYAKPYSMIDNGNLFFAACEYRNAYRAHRKLFFSILGIILGTIVGTTIGTLSGILLTMR